MKNIAKSLIALLATSCVLYKSNGMLDEEGRIQDRHLVKSSEGKAIENEYIATIWTTDKKCDKLRAKVDNVQQSCEGAGQSFGARKRNTKKNQIEKLCVIKFAGSESCKEKILKLAKWDDVSNNMVITTEARPASWGLDRIDQATLPLNREDFSASHQGNGVNVYIVDTGINVNHRDFTGRGRLGGDFVNEHTRLDDNGHGTHCAGTVGGNQYGVAKQATLIGVKVLSGGGSGSTAGVIDGVEWAVNEQKTKHNGQAAVISLSLGGGKNTAMDNAVKAAYRAGMIVVVAAGNEDQDACRVSPAAAGGSGAAGVVTVGATTSTDARSGFSNYGKCVDIFAPGSSITSAWKGGISATNTISGTSMATPHVAGVAAVLLEKHQHDRAAALAELFAITSVGQITDEKEDSPNKLLQVPTYTGPPTPPTKSPTAPPSKRPNELCVGGTVCADDFAEARYGDGIPDDKLLEGPLLVVKSDPYGCVFSRDDYRGKIVMVDRGGCLFFDKTKNAERNGAIALIIAMTAPGTPFPPNYYGDQSVKIPSIMIKYSDAIKFKQMEGQIAHLGSPDNADNVGRPNPSPEPTTKSPTARPTRRIKTRRPTPRPTARPTSRRGLQDKEKHFGLEPAPEPSELRRN